MPRRKPTEETETMTEATATGTATTEGSAKPTRKTATPVSSAELAAIVQRMQGRPFDEVCLEAGYYVDETLPDGTTKQVVTKASIDACRDAILASQGFSFAPPAQPPARRRNSKPILKVGKNGGVIIGARYMDAAGFQYGEGVETRLLVTAEAGRIVLTLPGPGSSSDDGEDGDEGDND